MRPDEPNPQISALISQWVGAGKPKQPGCKWPQAKWIAAFPDHAQLFIDAPQLLTRDYVGDKAQHSIRSGDPLSAFLISMAWGYGMTGYGRYRTNKVIRNVGFLEVLKSSGELAMSGDPISAFKVFEIAKPSGIKVAFATKYLYFASRELSREALILDSIIVKFLKSSTGNKYKLMQFRSDDYALYLDFMESQAKANKISAGNLEEVIFYSLNRDWGQ
jgi:hypothetical protein